MVNLFAKIPLNNTLEAFPRIPIKTDFLTPQALPMTPTVRPEDLKPRGYDIAPQELLNPPPRGYGTDPKFLELLREIVGYSPLPEWLRPKPESIPIDPTVGPTIETIPTYVPKPEDFILKQDLKGESTAKGGEIIAYHGTSPENIESILKNGFSLDKVKRDYGIRFSTDRGYSKDFYGHNKDSNVIEVKIFPKKALWKDASLTHEQWMEFSKLGKKEQGEYLIKLGYDSIVPSPDGYGIQEITVLDPSIIKLSPKETAKGGEIVRLYKGVGGKLDIVSHGEMDYIKKVAEGADSRTDIPAKSYSFSKDHAKKYADEEFGRIDEFDIDKSKIMPQEEYRDVIDKIWKREHAKGNKIFWQRKLWESKEYGREIYDEVRKHGYEGFHASFPEKGNESNEVVIFDSAKLSPNVAKGGEITVYHATTKANADIIKQEGIKQGMVTDTKADAEEYAQMLRNRGEKDVEVMELKIPSSQLEREMEVKTSSGKLVGKRWNIAESKLSPNRDR